MLWAKKEGSGREVREKGRQCTLTQMVSLHPFQTLTVAPTKLTGPKKLLHNWRMYENWVITSYPLKGILIYPVSLHLSLWCDKRVLIVICHHLVDQIFKTTWRTLIYSIHQMRNYCRRKSLYVIIPVIPDWFGVQTSGEGDDSGDAQVSPSGQLPLREALP